MTNQTGVYRKGTFGFPVAITLSTPPAPVIPLTGILSIALAVRRPSETAPGINRALPLPGAVINEAAGIIEWIVQDGDLSERGTYHLTFTLAFPGPQQLVIDGEMKVV
jgi:hypothetical protein